VSLPLVLIVDDNPENLTVIGELLQPQHAVRAANSGRRALQLAKLVPQPDLILLDVMMPEMDGYEVLLALRTAPDTAGIPVVFLTALNGSDDEERGLKLGAVDYITKPIRPPVLLARVRTQLALKQARDTMRQRNLQMSTQMAQMAQTLTRNQCLQDTALHALVQLAATRALESDSRLWRTQSYLCTLARALFADVPPDEPALNHPSELLQRACDLVRCRHERWDGTGLPGHLSGHAIPLTGRLMAVADRYDELAAQGESPLPHAQAVDLILAERGRHFDPAVVDAFVRCHEALRDTAARYPDGPVARAPLVGQAPGAQA
jgi:response regulator RpfG family c-di-GMP phosphodiesterase